MNSRIQRRPSRLVAGYLAKAPSRGMNHANQEAVVCVAWQRSARIEYRISCRLNEVGHCLFRCAWSEETERPACRPQGDTNGGQPRHRSDDATDSLIAPAQEVE